MRARKGFALVASLWLMVTIAALSLEISNSARNHRLGAANTLEMQQARAAAVSGVDHARARLARIIDEGGDRRSWRDPRHIADPWFSFDTVLVASSGRQRYTVRLHDLGSRLNVNTATEDELRRYFTALRTDAARVETVVQGILDWLDADDHRRLHGGERDDYLRAGSRALPRNAAVDGVEELAGVSGMTPALLRHARRDLTTLGTGRVNVNRASRPVLMSLPGFTEAAADELVRAAGGGRRIGSWTDLVNLVPRQARAPLQAASAQLLAKLTYETREVAAESIGTVDGSPVRAAVGATLVRAGSHVFVTWSVER